jgi:dTDP-4-dehydrorhamnose 3,5-epimerase
VLDVRQTGLDGVIEVRTRRIEDPRGFFSETWTAKSWAAAGIDFAFVQDNHSLSRSAGVLRGIHYQAPPMAQDKLVRVSRGSVFDVAVDLRRGSASFGRWTGLILSAAEWNQLLIPRGFGHAFLTLEPDTEVQYKTSAPYSAAHDRAVRFDDPAIGIEWPMRATEMILSEKDRLAPLLADIEVGLEA